MSTESDETAKALQDDPELKAQVQSAGSVQERASILRDAAVPVPTQADIVATQAHSDLDDINGGSTTSMARTLLVQPFDFE